MTTWMRVSLVLLSLNVAWATDVVVVGKTYDIAEPDALEEIRTRAAATDWQQLLKHPTWSALDHEPLSQAATTRTRTHLPLHTLDQAIHSAQGELLYPAGFQFNPLDYLTLPRRIVVIGPAHADWLEQSVQPTDLVLLAGGDPEAVAQQRPVFVLDPHTRARLGIEVVPSIIEQRGNVLVIDEVHLDATD